ILEDLPCPVSPKRPHLSVHIARGYECACQQESRQKSTFFVVQFLTFEFGARLYLKNVKLIIFILTFHCSSTSKMAKKSGLFSLISSLDKTSNDFRIFFFGTKNTNCHFNKFLSNCLKILL